MLDLGSPRWLALETSHGTIPHLGDAVRTVLARGFDGREWPALYELLIHQGTIYPAAYAVLPHVIAHAATREPATLASFWTDVGFLLGAPDKRQVAAVPADLVAGFEAALPVALALALVAFASAGGRPPMYRGAPILPSSQASYLALACVALARHHVGQLMWAFLDPPELSDELVNAMCPECEEELVWLHHGAGIIEERHADDPVPQPPLVLPLAPKLAGKPGPWAELAGSFDLETRFGPIARAVARAGVPSDAPDRTVICLVAAMVATHGELDWATRLARLASSMRCPACSAVSLFVDCLPELDV